jgi:hypothetical protein
MTRSLTNLITISTFGASIIAIGFGVAWVIVNAMIGCGEPTGSCWLVPWVTVDIPQ